MMISARRGAQIGLLAAIMVMMLSITILIVKGRDRVNTPRASFDQIANIQQIQPLKDQVVSSETMTLHH